MMYNWGPGHPSYPTPQQRDAYFTGVAPGSQAGHYCHPRVGHVSPWGSKETDPLLDWHPDRDGRTYPRPHHSTYTWADRCGGRRRAGLPVEPEGVFVHLVVEGWTLIAAWDRSADARYASTASFAFHSELTPAEALAEARARWPAVFARIEAHLGRPVEVEAWGGGA